MAAHGLGVISMQRIVVLNPKGGSGKTTLAMNVAAYYATRQQRPVLMDFDPQASSMRWVKKRQANQPSIGIIAAYEKDNRTTRSFQLRVPSGTTHVVIDTPAALDSPQMPDITRDAHKIIVPVLPSDIDIHACSRCIRDLLLVAKIRREDDRLGVVANRVRRNTIIYQSLIRFLQTLGIPVVTTIRDSQNYVRAAELGVGIHEMKSYVVREDIEQWQPLIEWLEKPSQQPQILGSGSSSQDPLTRSAQLL
jgi:chromosome partitioning protein